MKQLKWIRRTVCAVSAAAIGLTATLFVRADAAPKKLVVLGDSISAGYGLLEGEKGYYDILSDCTGMQLTNYAVSGYETKDLLAQLEKDEIKNTIKEADVICMSIGSNDMLHPTIEFIEKLKEQDDEDLYDLMRRLVADDEIVSLSTDLTRSLREPINIAKENIKTIEKQIRELNSNAQVIMFTLYNPFETKQNMFYDGKDYSSDYETFMDYVNGQENKISSVIKNLETVDVADISACFRGSGWVYLRDEINDIHPNPVGHALIASAVMGVMKAESTKSPEFVKVISEMTAADRADLPAVNREMLLKYAVPMGDLDGNDKWEKKDAEALIKYVSENEDGQLSDASSALSDINGDGSIDILDVTAILAMQ